jgi:hypothetical protein
VTARSDRMSKERVASVAIAAVLCLLVVPNAQAAGRLPRAASPQRCGWQPIHAPAVPGGLLYGVTAVPGDPGSAWAVGWNVDTDRAVVMRHDPSGWAVVDTGLRGRLDDISALGPRDLWATGGTTVAHFDGASWTRMKDLPLPRHRFVTLAAIRAIAPDDVWVMGYSQAMDAFVVTTFALHWNGSAWHRVGTPDPSAAFNFLLSVDGTGPDDVWAVGSTFRTTGTGGRWETLAIHWDGEAWSRVPSPSPGSSDNDLEDVLVSTSGTWAVGQYSNGGVSDRTPLVMRWNGEAWTQVDGPDLRAQFGAIAAPPSGPPVAVGYFEDPFHAFAATYRGSRFGQMPAGHVATGDLIDVTFEPDGTGWAVGAQDSAALGLGPLIEVLSC